MRLKKIDLMGLGGRPKKEIKREYYVKVRLTKEEKEAWEKRAENSGLKMSDFIRRCVSKKKLYSRFSDEEWDQFQKVAQLGTGLKKITNMFRKTSGADQLVSQMTEVSNAIHKRVNEIYDRAE
jgi:hypothetical protein